MNHKKNEDYVFIEQILFDYFYSEKHVNPRNDARRLLMRVLDEASKDGMRELEERITGIGFNEDCIFCGLKDKEAKKI